jgi:hypothetical protein
MTEIPFEELFTYRVIHVAGNNLSLIPSALASALRSALVFGKSTALHDQVDIWSHGAYGTEALLTNKSSSI